MKKASNENEEIHRPEIKVIELDAKASELTLGGGGPVPEYFSGGGGLPIAIGAGWYG